MKLDKILTIGVPVYNTEKYLDRCLESILFAESADKIEVIIVNDGSTDHSLVIARKWEQRFPESIVIVDKENGGHGSAVNAAVNVACGRYFRVLDSDDWFDKDAFTHFLHSIEKESADLVVTKTVVEETYRNKQIPYPDYAKAEYNKVLPFEAVTFMTPVMMPDITYRTEMLQRNYKPLQEKTFYVDNEYNTYPIASVETVLFLDLTVYRYFIGRPNQSMNPENRIRNLEHIRRVSRAMQRYGMEHLRGMDSAHQRYVRRLIYDVTRNYIRMILNYPMGLTLAERRKKVDEYVSEISNKEFLADLNKYKVYKAYKLSPFLLMLLLPALTRCYMFFKSTC